VNDLLSRLSGVLTSEQLAEITQALSNNTVTPALLSELVSAVDSAGACDDSHTVCEALCVEVLASCAACAGDSSLARMCAAL
jgi:hypothetical protein